MHPCCPLIVAIGLVLGGCGVATDAMEPAHSTTGEEATVGGYYLFFPLFMQIPPYNTVLFGPCKEEFGMPDARRSACNLHYAVRGKPSPWAEAEKNAATGKFGDNLTCRRTLSGVSECIAVGMAQQQPDEN